MEEYLTPSHPQRFEIEVKRSRFITSVASVADKSAAKQFIASLRTEFPDASHHCWACVAGAPDDVHQQDQSDDGEPKGTAGKPMLHVLRHSGLGNVIVVVSRYFGGVKLGAGGLVRAYTLAVSEALKNLETSTVMLRQSLTADLPYAELARFEHWLSSRHTVVADKQFTDSVLLHLQITAAEKNEVLARINEVGGRVIDKS